MSLATARRLAFVVAGLVLLLTPIFVRSVLLGYNRRPYTPADVPALSVAATPGPTAIPLPQSTLTARASHELRPGPVVVDLAHGNRITRSQFEPLAAALANRGLGMRFWMSDIDPMTVTNFLDYPDQSEELGSLLRGASGLVVVSPFFLWSKNEIAQAEQFVADGGRMLLISDPDVVGDLAQDINNLAEPFGIVFADDYVYDTVENDGNHVYVFASEFADDAAQLADSTIALYGSRTIAGDVTPQALTSDTTLSSLREGLTGLSTMVKGGLDMTGTDGGVLALGDFDVLTAPFVERHDNVRLTEYVADFLSSGERTQGVTDFPAYLGKDVTLVFANTSAVDAAILREGSRLQSSLEQTGRVLSVAGAGVLSETLTLEGDTGSGSAGTDLIVLADFALADAQSTLLSDLGFTRVQVMPTPPAESTEVESRATERATGTPPPTATPSPTSSPVPSPETQAPSATSAAPSTSRRGLFRSPVAQEQQGTTPEPLLTPTATFTPVPTATPSPTVTPTPSPTTTPQPEVYLETDDGLRLVAAETVLIAQRELQDGRRLVAVLGNDNDGIRSGIDRLLDGAFMGCVTSEDLAVCSVANGGNGSANGNGTHEPQPIELATETPEPQATASETATTVPTARSEKLVMVVDDNDLMLPGEISEADLYLKALTQQGYGPTLWTTSSDGIPAIDDITGYDWVIWSSGGYESGGPGLADLDALLSYINEGGALTISSRRPFFGMSTQEPSVIVDVAVQDDLPELVQGLPSTAIRLGNGLPPVTPLEINEEHAGAKVALTRGPDSNSAGSPLLFVVTDDKGEEPTGARLMVLGMSLTWLPDEFDQQLIRNMTGYMLAD